MSSREGNRTVQKCPPPPPPPWLLHCGKTGGHYSHVPGSSLLYTNLPLYAQLQWVIQLVIRFRHRNQKSWTMIRSVPPPIGGALTIHWSGRRSCDSITSPVAMAHEAPGLAMRNRQVTVGFKLWLKPIFLLNMSKQKLFLWPCQNISKKTFWA